MTAESKRPPTDRWIVVVYELEDHSVHEFTAICRWDKTRHQFVTGTEGDVIYEQWMVRWAQLEDGFPLTWYNTP